MNQAKYANLCKRIGLACYNLATFTILSFLLASMIKSQQLSSSIESFVLISFIVLHLYGLITFTFAYALHVKVFAMSLFVGLFVVFAQVATLLAELIYMIDSSKYASEKTSIWQSNTLLTFGAELFYIIASSVVLKYSIDLLDDLKRQQARNMNEKMNDIEMDLIASTDYESESTSAACTSKNSNSTIEEMVKKPMYTNHCCYVPVELSVIEEVSFTE